jgi:hypothetical protein
VVGHWVWAAGHGQSLSPVLDPVDVVGDQAVSLPVDIGSSICRRGLGQAEHPPVFFVDPRPQVPHLVRGLGLQSARCALATSSIATPPAIS